MIISVTNTKGGVGKTTTAVELAAGLARGTGNGERGRARRTLLVDADPQASATFALGRQLTPGHDIAAVLLGVNSGAEGNSKMSVSEVATPTYLPGLELVPGAERFANAAWGTEPLGSLLAIRDALAAVSEQYDAIVIDCPNALAGPIAMASMLAADAYIVPAAPKFLDVRGLATMLTLVQAMEEGLAAEGFRFPKRLGVLLTLYDSRTSNSKGFAEQARSFLPDVFTTQIRRYVDVERASGYGRSVVDTAPESQAAKDVVAFVDEVITRAAALGFTV